MPELSSLVVEQKLEQQSTGSICISFLLPCMSSPSTVQRIQNSIYKKTAYKIKYCIIVSADHKIAMAILKYPLQASIVSNLHTAFQ